MQKTKTQITINNNLSKIVESVQKSYPIYDVNGAIEHLIARGSADYLKEISMDSPLNTREKISDKNTRAVSLLLEDLYSNEMFITKNYSINHVIVKLGKFTDIENNDLDYANVPLGIIIKGSVIVNKNNKDTKKLETGDFIGLFETADYLTTHRSRNIGDWTLTTSEDTEILYFTKPVFETNNEHVKTFKEYLLETARADYVPQPISSLPLLDWLASHTTTSRLHDHAIVVHTHLLPNNVPLIRHLAHLVGVDKIFIVGKPYSNVRKSYLQLALSGIEMITINVKSGVPYSIASLEGIRSLWQKILDSRKQNHFSKLMILDDGGDIWTSIPWVKIGDLKIAGMEQTQRGISRVVDSKFKLPPIVSVATSGIKKEIESVFIAQSVTRKLNKVLDLENQKIGVLGMGSIGHSVYKDIVANGYKCYYYDPIAKDLGPGKLDSLDSLVDLVDVIIGATGIDVLHQLPFERIKGNKILISVSSADIEFASILNFAQNINVDPFDTIELQIHDNLSFKILNGGYPMNFDRINDATPDDEIVLTRCLLYIGMMQAEMLLREKNPKLGFYNLDPIAQHKLLGRWFQDVPEKSKQFNFEKESENIDKAMRSDFLNTPSVWID
jgi:D-isomer specific 2-hydroxyacid dehydrogenase, NAD binding domain